MDTIADVARTAGLVAAGVVLYTVVVLGLLLGLGERYHRVKQARARRAAGPAPSAPPVAQRPVAQRPAAQHPVARGSVA